MNIIWKFFLGLTVVIFLAIGYLPTLLSTPWGKQQLLQKLNAHLPGTMTATDVELSWFGPQKLKGIVFNLKTAVETEIPLHQFIFNKISHGSIHIKQLNLQFQGIEIKNVHGSIDLSLEQSLAVGTGGEQIKIEAVLENEHAILQGSLEGFLLKNQILITEPVELTLTSTHSDNSKLPEVTKLTIQPCKQQIPLSEINLKKLQLNGEIAIHHWIYQKMEIETLNISWALDGPRNQINSHLYGHTRMAMQDLGELYGDCKLSDWLTSKGKLQLDQLKLKAKAYGKALPVAVLKTLCERTTHLVDLLGDTIDYTIEMNGVLSPQVSGFLNLSISNPQLQGSLALEIIEYLSGPIHLQLKGENGNLSFDGHLCQKGLFLDRPFQMEIAANPKLGRSLLAEAVPILAGILHSEKPLRLTVEPEGFFLPIAPFDLASLRIEKASLELGHLTFQNEGQLNAALSLLQPGQHEHITAWCTPLYFNVLGGKATFQRMDILLLNRYPMALWGNIHFIKDKVDLRIGVTGTALFNALNIKGLASNYILQLPLTGTLRKASIDKTKATTRLSALVAQNQGSPQGLVLGTVLGIVSGDLTEERAPAPTTQPLPWAGTLLEEAAPKKTDRNLLKEAADRIINSVLH